MAGAHLNAPMHPWNLLGLDGPTADPVAIKRAYAQRLRVTRPDDDAGAYQALREAYDQALAMAADGTAVAVAPPAQETEAPPVHDEVAPPADPVPPEDSGPTPAWLCAAFVDTVRRGERLTRAHVETLVSALGELPLEARDEASVRFADAVIQLPGLSDGARRALRDHFGWTRDFRVERLMGPERLAALMAALPDDVSPETDPEVLRQFAELSAVQDLLRGGQRGFARLAALLLDGRLRAQLQSLGTLLRLAAEGRLAPAGRRLLAALGVGTDVSTKLHSDLTISRTVHAALLVALLVPCFPFGADDQVLSFVLAAATGLVALGITMGTITLSAWGIGLRARFAPGSTALPAWVPRVDLYKAHRVGIWLLIGATIALPRLAGPGGWVSEGLMMTYLAAVTLGLFLAQSNDVAETVTTVAVVLFLSSTLGLLPLTIDGALQVGPFSWIPVLFAWCFGNVTTGANGGYVAAWRAFRERPRLGLGFGLSMSSVPAAIGWAHARCGFVMMTAGSLLAGALALRLQTAGVPAWLTLAALPLALAAGYGLRALSHSAGQRLLAARLRRPH